MTMAGPIKPIEVVQAKTNSLPDEVFEVFNAAIVAAWNGHVATVTQDKVSHQIATALGITRAEVFERHLLDVEESYRRAGWDVEYDKPGYNETYLATFRFTHGKRG
jgi:hypothetical protein